MRLSENEIRSVAFGAIDIKAEDGKYSFFKCTPKQTEGWYSVSDTLGMRSLTTSGVRLDFHTNSKSLRFGAVGGNKFGVLIDGVLHKQFIREDGELIAEIPLAMPNGRAKEEVRVTLALPSHTIGELSFVELDDGAYIKPHKFDRKILFIGDSITQGHNTKYDTLSYAWQTTLSLNANSVINGIGGAFYHIPTFDKPNFDADTVIIAYGTNDCMVYKDKPEEMYKQVTGYLDLIKEAYSDKRVIVISPIFRADAEFLPIGEWFDKRRIMIENEARARGFIAISGLSLVPPLPECFADKYLHPNDLGFSVYALNLTNKLIDLGV